MKEILSVVTICFNNPEELIRTCHSVEGQTLHPHEHIIIDGSTNDEILQWLQSGTQPAWRKWVHERDNGISDAFNKGVRNTTGSIIQLLNSGDEYAGADAIIKAMAVFENDATCQWCHGKLQMIRGEQPVLIGKPFDPEKLYRGMRSTFHPTMFVKKKLFDTYGLFDTSLKIAMDYDFLIRIRNEKFLFLNSPLASFSPGGVSNARYLDSLKETRQCYEKYFGKSYKMIIWQWRLKLLHFLLQSPAGRFLYKIKKWIGLENM
jgi:GT2 family glycosyltransferase